MTDHAPGPWTAAVYGPRVEDGPTCLRVYAEDPAYPFVIETFGYSALDAANAQLIAAAPDLLAACENALAFLEEEGWLGSPALRRPGTAGGERARRRNPKAQSRRRAARTSPGPDLLLRRTRGPA